LSKITKFTALPNFSSGLKYIVKTKKNLSKTEKISLITEVENHLISITGDSYLSPKEWEIVSDTIVEKYPNLEDKDVPGQSVSIIFQISTYYVIGIIRSTFFFLEGTKTLAANLNRG